ncbi:36.4 kDa proline-rich protein [Citrus clementina]|uniref:36.4 kDa proline-rich protein n=1 Tax=Citrus clementina TaxID=85681 RepID=UPI000CED4178|nr:36.4 kDa proline-rich protein [Citrus x clementina]
MGKYQLASSFILILNLGTLLTSLACDCSNNPPPPPPPASKTPNCPPPPSSPSPKTPPPPSQFVKSPPPPVVKSAPPPPPPVAKSPPPPPPVVKSTPPPIVKPPPPNGPSPKSPPPPSVRYPPPPKQQTCPIDALKLGACVDVLGGLIHIGLGDSAKEKCCPLLQGLADLDAAVCLCTAIRLKALNLINLLVPISLQVLVNDCGKYPPAGFQCPA